MGMRDEAQVPRLTVERLEVVRFGTLGDTVFVDSTHVVPGLFPDCKFGIRAELVFGPEHGDLVERITTGGKKDEVRLSVRAADSLDAFVVRYMAYATDPAHVVLFAPIEHALDSPGAYDAVLEDRYGELASFQLVAT